MKSTSFCRFRDNLGFGFIMAEKEKQKLVVMRQKIGVEQTFTVSGIQFQEYSFRNKFRLRRSGQGAT